MQNNNVFIALFLAVVLFLFHGCGQSKPSNVDVQKYLQTQIPIWLTITTIETKSFISGDSGTGRTSAAITFATTEPLYRKASEQETQSAFLKFNLTKDDLYRFSPQKFDDSTLFVISYQKGQKLSFSTELECQAAVQGWTFRDYLDFNQIQGQPRSEIPPSAIILGTAESELYFIDMADKKKANAERKTKYVNWLKSYIAEGRKHDGMYNTYYGKYPYTLTLTSNPILNFEEGNKVEFTVNGKVHWNAQIPEYVENENGIQDYPVELSGYIDTPVKENEQLEAEFILSWYAPLARTYFNTGHTRIKLHGSVFKGQGFTLEPPNFNF